MVMITCNDDSDGNDDNDYLHVCADIMVTMGYNRKDVELSLSNNKYDCLTATYLLLCRPAPEVMMMMVYL